MEDPDNTRPEDLLRAAQIGKNAGLNYIYAGNLPGSVREQENTRCHHCGTTLIRRYGYFIEEYRLTPNGTCPSCATPIPGRWALKFDGQITDRPFLPRQSSSLINILN